MEGIPTTRSSRSTCCARPASRAACTRPATLTRWKRTSRRCGPRERATRTVGRRQARRTGALPPLPVGPHRAAARLALRGRPDEFAVRARRRRVGAGGGARRAHHRRVRGLARRPAGYARAEHPADRRVRARGGDGAGRGRDQRGCPAREALRDRGCGTARERDPRAVRASGGGGAELRRVPPARRGAARTAADPRRRARGERGRAATSTKPWTISRRSPSSPRRSRPRSSARGRPPMRAPDELRALVEDLPRTIGLHPSLAGLEEPMRYALGGGGKRIRPVLCLATAEAAGGRAEEALPAAVALELVHSFSLVHDDLPALDDDDERRGRPSAHVALWRGRRASRGRRAARRGVPPRARRIDRPSPHASSPRRRSG